MYVQFSNHTQLKTDQTHSNASPSAQAALQAAQALVGTGGDTGKETVRFCTTSGRAGAGRRRWRHRIACGENLYCWLPVLLRLVCPGPPESQWHTGIVCLNPNRDDPLLVSSKPFVSAFYGVCTNTVRYGTGTRTVPGPVHVLVIKHFAEPKDFELLKIILTC